MTDRSGQHQTQQHKNALESVSPNPVEPGEGGPAWGQSQHDERGEERRRQVRSSVQGWEAGGGFFESTIAGFIVGFGLDAWLNTEPWFVVVGIVVGSISGFLRVWEYAKREINPRER